eukprot:3037696-Pleurochrysis_carterae.AAC.1
MSNASSLVSIQTSPKASISSKSIQETPKASISPKNIQEGPKASITSKNIQGGPKASIPSKSIQEGPEASITSKSIQKGPEASIPSKSIQEGPKASKRKSRSPASKAALYGIAHQAPESQNSLAHQRTLVCALQLAKPRMWPSRPASLPPLAEMRARTIL